MVFDFGAILDLRAGRVNDRSHFVAMGRSSLASAGRECSTIREIRSFYQSPQWETVIC